MVLQLTEPGEASIIWLDCHRCDGVISPLATKALDCPMKRWPQLRPHMARVGGAGPSLRNARGRPGGDRDTRLRLDSDQSPDPYRNSYDRRIHSSGIDSPPVKVRDAASRLWSHGKRVSQYARKLLLTMKMASVDPDFAGTDAFYEMCGLDAETIARIQA